MKKQGLNEKSRKQSLKSLSSNSQKAVKKQLYTFRGIKSYQLCDLYQQIHKSQCQQNDQNTFPSYFSKSHQQVFMTYLFQLEVQDSFKKWTIIKRVDQLISLEQELRILYPQKKQIFTIPIIDETKIDVQFATSVLQLFVTFLNSIGQVQVVCKQKVFLKFVQNFVSEDKKRIKTFVQKSLNKKAGGRHTQYNITKIIYNFLSWRHKYFTITKQGVYYTDNQDSFQVRQMLPFNQSFSLIHGQIKTGYTYGIIINSSHRVLQIDAQNVFNFLFFIYFLRKAMRESQNSTINRFHSFAQIRQHSCQSQFYIDGQNYFKAVYNELMKAKNEIFITGWFITPFMYLIQDYSSQCYRLDKVLLKCAQNGCKIYILIYNAPLIALSNDPQFTCSYLSSLHPFIKILSHPNYLLIPFLWSHHQKLLIIDQSVGFMGGLDLAYARMDNKKHQLNDQQEQKWKNVEYCNLRKKDIYQPHQHQKCSIDRTKEPRMPWHDVGLKVIGPSVGDMARHFTQYWNYVNFQLEFSQRQLIMFTGINQQQLTINLQQDQQGSLKKEDTIQDESLNMPFLKNKIIKTDHPNQFSSFSVAITAVYDQPQLKKLKSCKQINDKEQEQASKNIQKDYYLSFLKQNRSAQKSRCSLLVGQQKGNNFSLSRRKSIKSFIIKQVNEPSQILQPFAVLKPLQVPKQQQTPKQSHQLLRSASLWSLGLKQGKQQRSILQAYCLLIQNSQHFIYIQNQFFISVENTICQKIINRIQRAYQLKEHFKVLIVVPFMPGFEGDVEEETAAVVRLQMHLMYQTICRGENSLYKRLQYIDNIDDYLGVYCLRNHGKINQIPVTQIIYVHSKIMIIDDSTVLIGSANINDRSLVGTRDSELAIVIQDGTQKQIEISQHKIFKTKLTAHNLRKQLYMQHFGLNDKQAQNFLDQKIWQKIIFNAQRNQKVYKKIFGCYPDNDIKSFQDIKKLKNSDSIELDRYDELVQLIKGYACPFQRDFLCNQNLQLKSSRKQYYVPYINFT